MLLSQIKDNKGAYYSIFLVLRFHYFVYGVIVVNSLDITRGVILLTGQYL
jgi:hypothetical protein